MIGKQTRSASKCDMYLNNDHAAQLTLYYTSSLPASAGTKKPCSGCIARPAGAFRSRAACEVLACENRTAEAHTYVFTP